MSVSAADFIGLLAAPPTLGFYVGAVAFIVQLGSGASTAAARQLAEDAALAMAAGIAPIGILAVIVQLIAAR